MDEPKITKKDQAFGRRLQRIRKRARISQENLAFKIGFTQTYISLIEVGKRRASLKALKKIASALNLKVRDLINF